MSALPSYRLTASRIANVGARAIHAAYDAFRTQFGVITRRARTRFETRDWAGMQADAAERLDLYRKVVRQAEAEVRSLLEDRVTDKLVWTSMKAVYSGRIVDHDDWDLAETFFNSITRRIFDTVGVDPRIEFVTTDFETPPTPARGVVYRVFGPAASLDGLVTAVLHHYQGQPPFQDLPRDVEAVVERIEARLGAAGVPGEDVRAEMVTSVFYRGMGAYLVGRLTDGTRVIPLVLALLHTDDGLVVDAVLLDEDAVSILFSFAHSYFHVEVERPYDLVRFLKTIIPRKRIAELYISLGYNRHGKTELYRDLLRHLAASEAVFEVAPGKRGMVMAVFTMPDYDVVFKVIKDRFAPPKNTSRRAIVAKYDLVFRHDRAGRLVDAQVFEHLKFDRRRFSDDLLEDLLKVAGRTVRVEGDTVVVEHAYVERRVTPLNLYVHEADAEAARAAVVDYGQALRDLAASNIFPGDLLLKNFGVTRHGRVVFYDYDELALLTDCNFRRLPPPRSYEDELAAEPWFYVHENDIFPEEFRRFLGLTGALRDVFLEHHEALLDVDFWQQAQARIQAGHLQHILPYAEDQRLPHRQHTGDLYAEVPGPKASLGTTA